LVFKKLNCHDTSDSRSPVKGTYRLCAQAIRSERGKSTMRNALLSSISRRKPLLFSMVLPRKG
jgi:hypothetical protein